VATPDKTPEEIAAEDRKADVVAIVIIFTALVLGALHFASGWNFDF
jgi:hypothetical protein